MVTQQEIVGTLKEYTSTSLRLKTNDGKEYQFSIVGATQEYKNGIEPGNWIHVYYIGNIDDTNTSAVNVRDNYSTNSNVLGRLQANDEVVRTGNCDNGWSRITYNGNTAYVYGQYLTTTAPTAPTQPAAADGTLIVDVDNQDYAFQITNAKQDYVNGLLMGNEVTITFQGDLDASANAVVYTVTDSAANTNNQSQITGTVKTASMNCIVIATDDNAILSISTGDAKVNVTGGVAEGVRVTATLDMTKTVDESNVFYASAVNDAVN